jgi:hypothetical protein
VLLRHSVSKNYQSYYGPGSTQPLIEMRTRNRPGNNWRSASKAHKFTAICEQIVFKNVGGSTSHKHMDLPSLLQK